MQLSSENAQIGPSLHEGIHGPAFCAAKDAESVVETTTRISASPNRMSHHGRIVTGGVSTVRTSGETAATGHAEQERPDMRTVVVNRREYEDLPRETRKKLVEKHAWRLTRDQKRRAFAVLN